MPDVKNTLCVILILLVGSFHESISNPLETEDDAKFSIISVTNGGGWGSWGTLIFCPDNSKAVGFDLKIEPHDSGLDDTALNAIRLHCVDLDTDPSHVVGTVTSLMGDWGVWGGRINCLNNGFLTSFQLRVEGPQNSGDDTAANNINFRCDTGEVLNGYGTSWGGWGEWSGTCPRGICGIQTRVEPPQGSAENEDDTALNDVQFFCC